MIVNKTGDEIVAVVVTFLYTHFQRVVGADAGLLQAARFLFISQEIIITTLVYQDG